MKKRKKKLPIGLSDFKEIIEYDYYYFDKTKFIENILEDRSKVKLFTRPRRFGKTLNISMLKYFFDVKNKDENKNLFEGLNISKSEYFNKQGEFPVISISFKDYNEKNWKSGFREVKGIIERLYTKYKFLTEKILSISSHKKYSFGTGVVNIRLYLIARSFNCFEYFICSFSLAALKKFMKATSNCLKISRDDFGAFL